MVGRSGCKALLARFRFGTRGILPRKRPKPCAIQARGVSEMTSNEKRCEAKLRQRKTLLKEELARMKADVVKWLFVAL
jgi:hypothetical protein